MPVEKRRALADLSETRIPVKRQAELLTVNRSSLYRSPKVVRRHSQEDLDLMDRIDRIHTAEPCYGSRRILRQLRRDGIPVNKKRLVRLLRIMDIYAIYPGPNLSKLYQAQYRHPYLLRDLAIMAPDQVWGIDITYIRMKHGFMYLFVIIDWFSRLIVDYELSSTLEKDFVLNCLKRAFQLRGKPDIMNSDQGSHFTCADYVALLQENSVRISMDGRGRARDNARTERFFRSLKYEDIFLNEYPTPRALRIGIDAYIIKYNTTRIHQSLDYITPAESYYSRPVPEAC
jgi:putative transposase